MKICIFHPYKFNGEVGGTDIYVYQLVLFIKSRGWESFIVCPSNSFTKTVVKSIEVYGIELYSSDTFYSLEGIKKSNAVFQFDQVIDLERPNIVHFHGFGKPYIHLLDKLGKLGIKTLLTPHLASLTCMKTSLMDFRNKPCDGEVSKINCTICLYKQKINSDFLSLTAAYSENALSSIFRFAGISFSGKFLLSNRVVRQLKMLSTLNEKIDGIIVLNNWFKEVLKKNGIAEKKVITIKTNYTKKINVFDSRIEEVQILFAGRQNTPKGLPLLLKSLKKAKFNKKIHLIICGPTIPSEEEHLLGLINLLKSEIRVSRNYNVNHEEITSIIQSSHLVILPSIDSEMCPLIVLEAQSNCIPVLGANHTGISDLIDDLKNGFLFDRNSEKDLIFKLENLINNNQLFELNKLLSENSNNEISFLDKHLLTYNELLE